MAEEARAFRCDSARVVILVVEVPIGCPRRPPPKIEVSDESVTQILGREIVQRCGCSETSSDRSNVVSLIMNGLHELRQRVPVTTVHATRKACASLLVALDVHPRVAMQILRQSQIAVTMDVYSQVTSDSTSRALKRLGEELEGR